MNAATAPVLIEISDPDDVAMEAEILRFLSGQNDGHELFRALYGAVLDEPIPEALLAVLRGAR